VSFHHHPDFLVLQKNLHWHYKFQDNLIITIIYSDFFLITIDRNILNTIGWPSYLPRARFMLVEKYGPAHYLSIVIITTGPVIANYSATTTIDRISAFVLM
jgi:hypothetical protein